MQRFIKNCITILITVAMVAVMGGGMQISTAFAQFNKEINYQGKLADSNGSTVADGDYDITFRLYDASTGGTQLWDEVRSASGGDGPAVSVSNGLFSVRLGRYDNLANVDFDQELWLSLEVESDGEMTPRKKLTSVPSAIEAENAQTVGGVASSSLMRSDQSDDMQASSSQTLVEVIQDGAGEIARFVQDNTIGLIIDEDGDTGVGTTTTPAQLTVQGSGSDNIQEWFNASGDSVAVIDDQGNVGIGTSAPSKKLSVAGGVVSNTIRATSTTATSSIRGDFEVTNGTDERDSLLEVDQSEDEITLGWGFKPSNGYAFQVESGGETRVGNQLKLAETNGTADLIVNFADEALVSKNFNNNNSESEIRYGMQDDTYFEATEKTNNLNLVTNNSEKMRITSSGQVGIGTSSPVSALAVSGTTTANAVSVNGDTISDFTGSGLSVNSNALQVDNIDSQPTSLATGSVAFSDGSTLTEDNSNFYWDSGNQRLGVGTNNPSERMEVSGSGGTRLLVNDSSGYAALRLSGASGETSAIDFGRGGSNYWGAGIKRQSGNNDFWIYDAPAGDKPRFVIDAANGNVGIGTTSPVSKLAVSGTTTVEADGPAAFQVQNTSGQNLIEADTANSEFAVQNPGGNGELQIWNDGYSVLRSSGMEFRVFKPGPGESQQLRFGERDGGRAITLREDWMRFNQGGAYLRGVDMVQDNNGNELLGLTSTSSAVNYLDIGNAASGNSPTLTATGTDANVDLELATKGNGNVGVGTSSPNARLTVDEGDINLSDGNAYQYAGQDFAYASTTQSATALGIGAEADYSNVTAIGKNAASGNSNTYVTAIGNSAAKDNTEPNLVVVGDSAGQGNEGDNLVAVGRGAGFSNSGNRAVGVGKSSVRGNSGQAALGFGGGALNGNSGDYAIGIGEGALKNNTYNSSIGLGKNASTTAANQFVVGSDTDTNGEITEARIGANTQDSFPLIYANQTGLGLGTTSPSAALDIERDNGNPRLSVGSSTATDLFVGSGGNVGIDTTSPTAPLEFGNDYWRSGVPPSIGISNLRPAIVLEDESQSEVVALNGSDGNFSVGVADRTSDDWGYDEKTTVFQANKDGTVRVDGGDAAGGTLDVLDLNAGGGGGTGLAIDFGLPASGSAKIIGRAPGGNDGDLEFHTADGGSLSQSMIIDGDGGKVGIGTSSPSNLFTVASSSGGPILSVDENTGNVGLGTTSPEYGLQAQEQSIFAVTEIGDPDNLTSSTTGQDIKVELRRDDYGTFPSGSKTGEIGFLNSQPGNESYETSAGMIGRVEGNNGTASLELFAEKPERERKTGLIINGTGNVDALHNFTLQGGNLILNKSANSSSTALYSQSYNGASRPTELKMRWDGYQKEGEFVFNATDDNNNYNTISLFEGNTGYASFGGDFQPTASLDVKAQSGQTEPVLNLRNASGTTLFTTEEGGNVGIGTSSPNSRLTVEDDSDNPRLSVGSSTKTNLFVGSDGNVGVGTSSIDAKLTVDTNKETKSQLARIISNRTDYYQKPKYDGLVLDMDSEGRNTPIRVRQNNSADNYSNADTTFVVQQMNNEIGVGINKDNPDANIDIEGKGTWLKQTRGNDDLRFSIADENRNTQRITVKRRELAFDVDDCQYCDPAERLRIDGSGNVGIGTSSPGAKLGVAGDILADNITATGTIYAKGGTIETDKTSLKLSTANSQVRLKNSAYFSPQADSGLDLGRKDRRWNSLYLSGPVEDGNDNELLDFISKSSAVNYLNISNSTSGNSPTLTATGTDANVDLELATKGNGGVGIGTSSPDTALEVDGDVTIPGGSSDLLIDFGTPEIADNNGYLNLKGGSNGFWLEDKNGTRFLLNKGGRDVGIGLNALDSINRRFVVYDSSGDAQTRLTHTKGTDYTDLLTNSSGNFSISPSGGNVGIGTTSPDTQFQVSTSSPANATSTFDTNVVFDDGGFSYDAGSNETNIDNLALGATNFESDAGIVSWVDMPVTASSSAGTENSYTAQLDGQSLLTAFSESDGSGGIQNKAVGIGTSSPVTTSNASTTLSVNGNFFVGGDGTGTSTITDSLNVQRNLKVGTSSLLLDNNSITNISGDLALQPNANNNVGIGTTTPSEALEVSGNITVSSSSDQILPGSGTKSNPSISWGASSLGFYQEGGSKLRLVGNSGSNESVLFNTYYGSMGINNLSPGKFDLEIQAQDGSGGTVGVTGAGGNAGDASTIYMGANRAGLFGEATGSWRRQDLHLSVSTSTGNSYLPATTTNSQFMIDGENGNIGIQHNSPSSALDVDGSINISDGNAYRYAGNDFAYASTTQDVTAVGIDAGAGGITGESSLFGYQAGQNNTGTRLTSVGYRAGQNNTGKNVSTYGFRSAEQNSGDRATIYGYQTATKNSGSRVTAIGNVTARENSGNRLTAVGYWAARNNTKDNVTAIGTNALRGDSITASNMGSRALGIGAEALRDNTGDDAVGIGYQAGNTNSFDSTIALGNYASTTAANQFVVGSDTNSNGEITEARIGANTQDDFPLVYANQTGLGLGTTSPSAALDIERDNGNPRLSVGSSTATDLFVGSGGNVGIDTTSPTAPLEFGNDYWRSGVPPSIGISNLRPAIAFEDESQSNVVALSGASGNFGVQVSERTSDDWGYDEKTTVFQANKDGTVRVDGGDASGGTLDVLDLNAGGGEGTGLAIDFGLPASGSAKIIGRAPGGNDGDLEFHTADGGSLSQSMIIDGDGGKVGIGTSSPSSKLTISGDASVAGNRIKNVGGLSTKIASVNGQERETFDGATINTDDNVEADFGVWNNESGGSDIQLVSGYQGDAIRIDNGLDLISPDLNANGQLDTYSVDGGRLFLRAWIRSDNDLNEKVSVEFTNDNGGSWLNLETLENTVDTDTDTYWRRVSFDITPYLQPGNVHKVQFDNRAGGSGDKLYIDNVSLVHAPSQGRWTGADQPGDISYAGGSVNIGTSTSGQKLQIDGGISASGELRMNGIASLRAGGQSQDAFDGFEDGDVSEWTVSAAGFSATTSRVYEGSFSGGVENFTGSGQIAEWIPSAYSGGKRPDSVAFYMRSQSGNHNGGAIELLDSDGDVVVGIGDNSPEWQLRDEDSPLNGYDTINSSVDYGWRYVRFDFHWAADEYTYLIQDADDSSVRVSGRRALKSNKDLERFNINDRDSVATSIWVDNILFANQANKNQLAIGPNPNTAVGIGTTSPTDTLSVSGTSNITGTTTLATDGGNVGIGESNPSAPLTVNQQSGSGAALFTSGNRGANVAIRSPQNDGELQIMDNTGYGSEYIFRDESVTGGSRHDFFKYNHSSGKITFNPAGSGNSVFNSGNVGIGTSSPNAVLDIERDNGNPRLSVGSSTATDLFVGSGGNVGIGTNSPGSDMELKGKTFTMDGRSSGGGMVFALDNNSAVGIELRGASNSLQNKRIEFYNDDTKRFETRLFNNNYDIRHVAGNAEFSIQSDDDTVFSNTNVGIGTTSPYAKLSVAGTSSAERFEATATSATSTFAGGISVNDGSFSVSQSTGQTDIDNLELGATTFGTNAGNISWTDLPVTADASAGVTQAYTAQIDGNPLLTVSSESDGSGGIQNEAIGIGTSSPVTTSNASTTLSINGNFYVGGDGTGTSTIQDNLDVNGNLQTGDLSFANDYYFTESDLASTTPDRLFLNTPTDETALTVDEQARIGLGQEYTDASTTIPQKLSVRGGLRVGSATTSALFSSPSTQFVGIGTTSPDYDLEVDGKAAAKSFVNVSTEDAKEGIEPLGTSTRKELAKKMMEIDLKQYNYKGENGDGNNGKRLGLIAEDAPADILSDSGKGVDLYEMTSATLASLQETSATVSELRSQVNQLTNGSSTASPNSSSSNASSTAINSKNVIAIVASWLSDQAITIKDGVVETAKGVFGTVETDQLVIDNSQDQATSSEKAADRSAGSGLIPTDATSTTITNYRVATTSQVIVTFTDKKNGGHWVEKEDEAFTLNTSKAQQATTTFDYLVIGVKEESDDTATSTATTTDVAGTSTNASSSPDLGPMIDTDTYGDDPSQQDDDGGRPESRSGDSGSTTASTTGQETSTSTSDTATSTDNTASSTDETVDGSTDTASSTDSTTDNTSSTTTNQTADNTDEAASSTDTTNTQDTASSTDEAASSSNSTEDSTQDSLTNDNTNASSTDSTTDSDTTASSTDSTNDSDTTDTQTASSTESN